MEINFFPIVDKFSDMSVNYLNIFYFLVIDDQLRDSIWKIILVFFCDF